jgi:hypothetical protein
MKKILVLLATIGLSVSLIAITASQKRSKSSFLPTRNSKPDIPEDIYKIVERSCFHCHSDNSSNFAAKGKLNFSNWNDYNTARKISRLSAICDVITKGKMPKKKFIKQFPDKILSPAEKETICTWAAKESDKLLGE